MSWIRKLFGSDGGPGRAPGRDAPGGVLPPEEAEKIGTEEDLLVGYEAALERNMQAARAEERGDVEGAIRLYEGRSRRSSSAPTPTNASPPSTKAAKITPGPSASPRLT